jgi:hypothetical protein
MAAVTINNMLAQNGDAQRGFSRVGACPQVRVWPQGLGAPGQNMSWLVLDTVTLEILPVMGS